MPLTEQLVEASCGGVLGLVLGSFSGTIIARWPRHERTTGRSRCDQCREQVQVRDLIPVASFLLLRGRCRFCSRQIDPVHTVIEAAVATSGALSFYLAGWPDGFFGLVLGWLLVTLAVLDWRHFWLPDALTLPLAVAGLAATEAGFVSVPDAVFGGVAGCAALVLVSVAYLRFRGRAGLGLGDAKLFGALGVWLGWERLPLLMAISGGLGILCFAITRFVSRASPTDRIPLGTFLALSGWLIWMSQWA